MIKMAYHDDGKQKWQSHEIYLKEDDFYNSEFGVFSHDPFEIIGYGETKEEAIEDFKKRFQYVMNEWKAFEKMLLDTDIITDNIVIVDCFGKEIKD